MAINGTAVQTGANAAAATTLTVDGSSPDAWSRPSAGNLLVAVVGVRGINGNDNTVSLPSGFAVRQSLGGDNGWNMRYAVGTKVAAGDATEDSLSFSVADTCHSFAAAVLEIDSTDLDLSSIVSASDETNNGTDVTSQGTGSASNTVDDALAVYLGTVERSNFWDDGGGVSWSVGVEQLEYDSGDLGQPGCYAATEVLTAAGSNSSTFSTGDTGHHAIGAVLVINGVSGSVATADGDGEAAIGEAQLPSPVAPETESYTISPAFSGAINAATLDPDGAAINITALLSGLTTSAATVTAPDIALLRSTWNTIRLGVAYDIEFTDGTDTARGQITFQPGVVSRFATVGGSPGGLAHPAALTSGDECLGYWLTGAGPVIPETGAAAANQYVAGQATLLPFGYDVSAGQWIEGTVVTFDEPVVEVDGAKKSKLTLGRLAIGV